MPHHCSRPGARAAEVRRKDAHAAARRNAMLSLLLVRSCDLLRDGVIIIIAVNTDV